jgi:hypothetical protein
MQNKRVAKWMSIGLVLLVLVGIPGLDAVGENKSKTGTGKVSATPKKNVVIKATWYNPQNVKAQKTYPLAVILASPKLPTGPGDYWIKTLWKKGFCILVLQGSSQSWAHAQVSDITAKIQVRPQTVLADVNRMLLIADTSTGSQALEMIDMFSKRVTGAVLISVVPVKTTRNRIGLWQPATQSQTIPIWIVQGTKPDDAAKRLEMWRRACWNLPSSSNITIDSRIGRGVGNLLPGRSVERWLNSIAAGKVPAKGPDPQMQQEVKDFAGLGEKVQKLLGKQSTKSNGTTFTKTDGDLKISVTAPKNWKRFKEFEHQYNPKGLKADANGKEFKSSEPQYFSNIYLTPFLQSRLFARVCAAELNKTGKELIEFYQQQLSKKGYLVVPLWNGKINGQVYNLSSIIYLWRGKWRKWVVLMGTPENSKNKNAAPLVLVLDSGKPTPKKLTAAMMQLIGTVKVDSLK